MKFPTAISIVCPSLLLLMALAPVPALHAATATLQCPLPLGTAGVYYASGVTVVPPGTVALFALTAGSLNDLTLNPKSGQITGLPEAPETLSFTIQAKYGSDEILIASSSCTIKIGPPPVVPPVCTPSTAQDGSSYNRTIAASGGGGSFSYTATGLPPGITLSPTGTLSGIPSTAGSYTYEITTADTFGQSVESSCSINVAPPLLTTACNLPQQATVGSPFSGSITASGGTPQYSFALTSAPAGFSINPSSGAVNGTPTVAEIGPATIQGTVTDKNSTTTTFSCSVPIKSQPITIACGGLPPAIVGEAYAGSVTIAGGSQTYNVSATGPSWLNIGNTGTISGSPNVAGAASNNFLVNFNVSVTDVAPAGFQQSQTQSCSLQVLNRLSAACSLGAVAADSPATGMVSATGGLPPYSYALGAGVPAGWTINAATGAIKAAASVTNSVGTFSIPVLVTDSSSQTSETSCSLDVTYTPSLTLTGLPTPANNQTSVSIALGQTAPVNAPVSGTLDLTFQPIGPGVPAGCAPWATFAQNQLPSLPFTIGSGQQTEASLENIMLITPGVAGTVTVSINDLTVGGTPVATSVAPVILTIQSSPPSITAGSLVLSKSGNAVAVQFNGISSTRDLQSASVTFNPAAGATLSGNTSATIPLTGEAVQYYGDSNSCYEGGAFGVTLSFTISGDPAAIGSATVTVTNSAGVSASRTTQ